MNSNYLLGYNAMQSVENQDMFRRNISSIPSGFKIKSSVSPTFTISCSPYPSTLKKDAIFSTESNFNVPHGVIPQKISTLYVQNLINLRRSEMK